MFEDHVDTTWNRPGQIDHTHACDYVGPHQSVREELLTCKFHSLAFRLVTTDFIFCQVRYLFCTIFSSVWVSRCDSGRRDEFRHETRTRGLTKVKTDSVNAFKNKAKFFHQTDPEQSFCYTGKPAVEF